jgi:iron complex outermembrane recepter protein
MKMMSRRMSQINTLGLVVVVLTLWSQAAVAQAPRIDTTPAQPQLAQVKTQLINITQVKLQPSGNGIEIGADGKIVDSTIHNLGKVTYIDVPNAVLALPDGKEFRVENPTPGIAKISVTQVSPTFVRVLITGTSELPDPQVVTNETGAIVTAIPPTTPQATNDDAEIEINVVGLANRRGYRLPDSVTGTKTDTPLRDVPFAIQVIPPQVIADLKPKTITEAIQNVSGANLSSSSAGRNDFLINFRGFNAAQFRDGFRENFFAVRSNTDFSLIDRIEVLKGPSSALFGQSDPAGVINVITKKPLDTPAYSAEFTAGNYSFYRSSVDLGGPLDENKNISYRVNLGYENSGSFRDPRINIERLSIAPVVNINFNPNTSLLLGYERLNDRRPYDAGSIAVDDRAANIPRDRFLGDPTLPIQVNQDRVYAIVNHKFNPTLSLRSAFRITSAFETDRSLTASSLQPDNRTLNLGAFDGNQEFRTYAFQNDLTAKFSTGSIAHSLLVGVEYERITEKYTIQFPEVATIDIFNPVYNFSTTPLAPDIIGDTDIKTAAVYLQDQVTLANNLKLLLGLRYQSVTNDNTFNGSTANQTDTATTPRVGIVYQPIAPISLYANYARSFVPNSGRSQTNEQFQPELGTQFEVGVKADLTNKIAASFAVFDITKSNVLTSDPTNSLFSVQTGEQRSRGFELDLAGEIMPNWNIIASYANTNAEVSRDNTIPVGNRLASVPRNTASLWTTYRIANGDLKGLGFGVGMFFVDSRQGDLANSFTIDGYLRTDAAIYYNRDDFNAALNFKNLFNTNYIAGSTNRTELTVGAPFTVLATVGWKF